MDKELYNFIVNKNHHIYRKDFPEYDNIAENLKRKIFVQKKE